MFNDKYGLTDAVLEGRKTMTRRIVPKKLVKYIDNPFSNFVIMKSPYKVGEIVAVAQSYYNILKEMSKTYKSYHKPIIYNLFRSQQPNLEETAGWTNKMFVKPEIMPHQIRITSIKVMRLQDINDQDCLKEGVERYSENDNIVEGILSDEKIMWDGKLQYLTKSFNSHREAFASLIDKISGKGTWNSNPYVFVYQFELVK